MLTDTQIKNAQPKDKPYKLFDRDGLYVLVTPQGARLFRHKFRFAGKEKLLAYGRYDGDTVTLRYARDRCADTRKLLLQDIDPTAKQRAERSSAVNTFKALALEWHGKQKADWTEKTSDTTLRRFETYVFPFIGEEPIDRIETPAVLDILQRIERAGIVDSGRRVRQIISNVFLYAVATGRAKRDPSYETKGAIKFARRIKHLASIKDPKELGALLRAIDSYDSARVSSIVRSALQLAPLVFVRPGELRGAEWSEFDLDGAQWRIPAERMKMREQHLVPLSKQALMILRGIQRITGEGRFVFPSARTDKRCMSDNALLAALRRMGFEQGTVTVHGFRSSASTLLNEQGWHRDAIERQLAHGERDEIRGAYNHAEHLPERRKMMQRWADYLDVLKGRHMPDEFARKPAERPHATAQLANSRHERAQQARQEESHGKKLRSKNPARRTV